MSDAEYLRKILADRYGIKTDADLDNALRAMTPPDIGVMKSQPRPATKKECEKWAC